MRSHSAESERRRGDKWECDGGVKCLGCAIPKSTNVAGRSPLSGHFWQRASNGGGESPEDRGARDHGRESALPACQMRCGLGRGWGSPTNWPKPPRPGCNTKALWQPAPQRPHVTPGGRGRGCRGRKTRPQSSECFMSGYLRLLVRRGARFCHGRRSRARKSTRCLDAHNSTMLPAPHFTY